MPHMIPEYSNENFVEYEDDDMYFVPEEYFEPSLGDWVEVYEDKWFCRLSAPGYLDCTDWSGPFDSLGDAQAYIMELYEVDPVTGDSLE